MHRLSNGILRFNRAQGSKGQSCIFACSPDDYSATQQTILEQAGVSISIVQTDASRSHIRDHPGGLPFFVVDISLVVHPRNPHHGSQIYPTFKKWCDEYFHIPHWNDLETRGLGVFFNDLNEGAHARLPLSAVASHPNNPAEIFALVKDLGGVVLPSCLPVSSSQHSLPYTPQQRRWQLIRRGRYVEFNLVHDRGTKFGPMTPGVRTLTSCRKWRGGSICAS